MQSKMIAGFIIALIVVGVGSFYGGMQYQKSQAPVRSNGAFGRGAFAGGQGRGGMGGGLTTGEVLSKDANSITVKGRDGSSKIVIYATSTRIGKTTDGSINDVIVGSQVMVNGTANSDGSVTASNIQIRPAVPQGMMEGGNATGTVKP